MKDDYSPSVFVRSKKKDPEWKSLYDEPLDEVKLGDIREYKDFIKQYSDVQGFDVHGQIGVEYQYLNDTFRKNIAYDVEDMKIWFLDIEVIARDGFPDIQAAADPIVLVAVRDKTTKKTVVFGGRTIEQ